MASPIKVVHYGLGPIGIEAARVTFRRPGIVAVGAVDKDPAKAGKDLADLAGLPAPTGVVVRASLSELPAGSAQVAGVRQVGTGYRGERAAITLELQMYVGAEKEGDEVWIEGRPNLHFACDTGFPGDISTTAILVNAAVRVVDLPPGLCTMKDLPPAHYRSC